MVQIDFSKIRGDLPDGQAARREKLKARIAGADTQPPLLHPEMAELYRKVATLAQALAQPESRTEASEALRGLIDAIILTPTDGEPPSRDGEDSRFGGPRLRIELKGNLAAMLSAATNAKRSPETSRCKLKWLRGRATAIICSSGASQPEVHSSPELALVEESPSTIQSRL